MREGAGEKLAYSSLAPRLSHFQKFITFIKSEEALNNSPETRDVTPGKFSCKRTMTDVICSEFFLNVYLVNGVLRIVLFCM